MMMVMMMMVMIDDDDDDDDDEEEEEAHDIMQGQAFQMSNKMMMVMTAYGISGMQIVLWLDGLNASQKLD